MHTDLTLKIDTSQQHALRSYLRAFQPANRCRPLSLPAYLYTILAINLPADPSRARLPVYRPAYHPILSSYPFSLSFSPLLSYPLLLILFLLGSGRGNGSFAFYPSILILFSYPSLSTNPSYPSIHSIHPSFAFYSSYPYPLLSTNPSFLSFSLSLTAQVARETGGATATATINGK